MNDSSTDLDIHMSVLAGWLVQTIGKALLLATAVSCIAGLALALSEDALWLGVGVLASGLVFAGTLYGADPPLPPGVSVSEAALRQQPPD